MHRKPHSEATKEKIRKAHLGKKLTKEHRDKVIRTLQQGKGDKNPGWKGGRTVSKEGYAYLRMPEHPFAQTNGYIKEHRYVMEQHLGRYLGRDEIIHHINGIKSDNRIENLELTDQRSHGISHWVDPELREERSKMMKEIRSKKFWSTR
jgi:hypothetical protein